MGGIWNETVILSQRLPEAINTTVLFKQNFWKTERKTRMPC